MSNNIKRFIGEQAYKFIENSAYNADALRSALITPQNARAVFSDLSEYEVRSLVAEISNSGTIGQVRPTTQEEIIAAFAEGGYTTVIFDDKDAISECAKYYRDNERICTYNSLENRMREYHMLVAVKGNIDTIKRSDNPQRDDEYGTSIINIQIARNGSHMSIKNRYNHTVDQCDSTFNNDLNHITMGLQSMVLGYYGFAGLTRGNNKRYNNIVTIGGVYLKYHIERNNIYFGAFVLDGTNGARYTDSSRYYITDNDKEYGYSPMILDFHDKKAIDLIGKNDKIPLISRAMREGIIHSGNKEQAETICAVFQNANKELLQANRKALKYVAEEYGYDFQKSYKVTGILGNFTAKSIEKIIGSDNAILLLSISNNLHVTILNHGKFQIKGIKGRYNYNIDSFYTQGDFENKRKSGNTALYVIQQDTQYLRTIKKESSNEKYQPQLRERLAIYKANKRKAEVQATDYTDVVRNIDNEFSLLKSEIVTRFTNANKYEDYDKLTTIINYKFSWLTRHIEIFKESVATKNFTSTQQAQDLIISIKEQITKIWGNFN